MLIKLGVKRILYLFVNKCKVHIFRKIKILAAKFLVIILIYYFFKTYFFYNLFLKTKNE